ncbi:hypothetical protein I6G79_10435 [Burkholderia plantarii]|nr:hypothetical protein [Burkholderia plantarii]
MIDPAVRGSTCDRQHFASFDGKKIRHELRKRQKKWIRRGVVERPLAATALTNRRRRAIWSRRRWRFRRREAR